LYIVSSDEYTHHLDTYGHPSEFGYQDFVLIYKAEAFNAVKWAQVIAEAGAHFDGLIAEHHKGRSNWDSESDTDPI